MKYQIEFQYNAPHVERPEHAVRQQKICQLLCSDND